MARKRKRVPEVLWRLFRHRARSLAETILALIPPPPATASGCRCKGPRCLYCSGEEVMSFLVRPDDPSDYRKLLTGCFVVVSENAPPLPVFDPHCRWSQCEIVRRSIEMIMHEVPSSSNLICCSYDKDNRSSAVVDELTSPKWTILLRRVFSKKIRKEEINLILIEHIMRNVVQFDNKFYLQLVGIPQGSVLSSLLCSFYYGHMERNVVFPFLEKANGDFLGKYDTFGASASQSNHTNEVVVCGAKYLLLRFIDDFLFISTSKKQASMFFSRLERGIRDYNCWMNDEKFGLNFDINGQGCRSNRLHVGKDGTSFLRWSGVLVNCSTLEIQADYTRYLNSHLSSTLTVSCRGKVGCQLKAKLRRYLQPKCHPLFYDSNINSPGVVRLNIYQAFLLCAMKFVCYISKLSILPRFCPIFCINAISASLRYMSRLIKRKVYSFDIDNTFRPKYDVKKKDVIWLGLHAYSRVFQKKQSRHKKLLCLFRSRLKPYGRLENMSPELKYAVDDARSSVLWSIKY
ncbi:UNVERIFIED_CONTAM: Telomerase reverse transcriptase [Sesamum indicum]